MSLSCGECQRGEFLQWYLNAMAGEQTKLLRVILMIKSQNLSELWARIYYISRFHRKRFLATQLTQQAKKIRRSLNFRKKQGSLSRSESLNRKPEKSKNVRRTRRYSYHSNWYITFYMLWGSWLQREMVAPPCCHGEGGGAILGFDRF